MALPHLLDDEDLSHAFLAISAQPSDIDVPRYADDEDEDGISATFGELVKTRAPRRRRRRQPVERERWST